MMNLFEGRTATTQQRLQKWVPTQDLLELRRLGKSLEEMGECVAIMARCIIQGIDGADPKTGAINRVRMWQEMADVAAQFACTAKEFSLPRDLMMARTADKIDQMYEWEEMFK